MKTVRFEGYLKDLYPDGITLEASSPAEAILGLQTYPGFRESDEVRHHVELPKFQSRDSIYSPTDEDEILVVPVAEGAGGKKGGFFQIILGVFLIVAAAVLMVATGGLATPLGIGMEMAGASLILGGVLQLLMPTPKAQSVASEDDRSKYIPANKNTVKTGTPIPLLYGRRKVFGHFLSFDIDSSGINDTPLPDVPPPDKGMVVKSDENGVISWLSAYAPNILL